MKSTIVWFMGCLCGTVLLASRSGAQTEAWANHVLLPPSRVFAYTAETERTVRIYEVEASITITEASARTTLDIRIENMTDQRQEAELLLPVPEDAVVSDFAYDGPGDLVSAQVLARDEAVRIYNQLVARIKDPALVEFVGFNLIRSSIFPLEARARQRLLITYEHVLQIQGNRVDYLLPRTESLQYQIPWTIRADVRAAQSIATVYSPSHTVFAYRVSDSELSIIVESEAKFTPGPFQLTYLVDAERVAASIMAYPDDSGEAGYFLVLAGVPEVEMAVEENDSILRELTLVIDRSGSMQGRKIEQAKEAAVQVVEALDPGEAFNVIIYNSGIEMFSPQPILKNATSTLAALSYISALTASGGTNMHGALELALLQDPVADTLPLVLFLTDGLPTSGNTNEIDIRNLALTGNPHDRRVFTFGVGYNVNAPLLDGIAELSRGTATFVLPEESVEEKVAQVFGRLAGPVIADPVLAILDDGGTEAMGRTQDVLPRALKDLFAGDRLIVLGRYLGDGPILFELSGNYLGDPGRFRFRLDPVTADQRHGFIPRLWASRKIAELIDEIQQLGADSSVSQDDPLIQEYAASIIDLSTAFGIITEYTAFLALEGTDLSNAADLLGQTAGSLAQGAGRRTGSGGVSQSMNSAAQRSQDVLNRDNSYLNSSLERNRIVNAQQANDLTFFFKDGKWVDSRLADLLGEIVPERTVEFASDAFFDLALGLAMENRQGALAFAQDILLRFGAEIILIDIPESIEERYEPEDPHSVTSPGMGRGGGRRGR